MLRYGGYTWLLDVRDSPIQARIGPSCRTREEVHWQVDLHYIAAGREWRRVKSWLRPTLHFCVYDFQPVMESWHDLNGQSFDCDKDGNGCAGTLFLESTRLDVTAEWLNLSTHRLRFIKRTGFWFTTELVAAPPNRQPASKHSLATASVSADESSRDSSVACELDPAAVYMVEDLPFGLVEVAAPANSRSPQQYAQAKARELIGLNASAEIDVGPKLASKGKEWRPVAGADWRVRLHHGARWTHFML